MLRMNNTAQEYQDLEIELQIISFKSNDALIQTIVNKQFRSFILLSVISWQ